MFIFTHIPYFECQGPGDTTGNNNCETQEDECDLVSESEDAAEINDQKSSFYQATDPDWSCPLEATSCSDFSDDEDDESEMKQRNHVR